MLYIFNKNEELLEIIDNFYDDEYKRQVNKDYTFTFKVDINDSNNIKRKNKVGFYDEDNRFQLFSIEEIETNYFKEDVVDVFCQHDYYSLNDNIIEDKRILEGTCREALTKALEGTKYSVGEVADLHINTLNFYFISSLKALNEIVKTYGGELDFRLELNEDKTAIAKRYIDIKYRLGKDTGIRFTYDTNIQEIKRNEIADNHYTVLYGRGSSLETEEGGHSRLIDFSEVEWNTPLNPANKPKGNKFIEDLDAISKYGRLEGIYENKDIKEPKKLLEETWNKLQEVKNPKISYTVLVDDLSGVLGYEHLKTNLGDSIIILDEDYNINLESRIIEEKYSMRDIEATKEITLGYILPSVSDSGSSSGGIIGGDDLDKDEPIINGGNFPNTLPDVPVVTTSSKGFKSIELSWTYENKLYYNYEVYASQLENFNPTPDNLIFKGQASVFLHEVQPKQTWYYRVRAGNTHNEFTEFSSQVSDSTTKIADGAEYFENAAINSALIGSLNADVIDSGRIKGTYVDARNLSVTDGNGSKTLDIDSYGNVKLKVKELNILSKDSELYTPDSLVYKAKQLCNEKFYIKAYELLDFMKQHDPNYTDDVKSEVSAKLDEVLKYTNEIIEIYEVLINRYKKGQDNYFSEKIFEEYKKIKEEVFNRKNNIESEVKRIAGLIMG